MQRKASAVWQGDLKAGKGTLSTAHAGCFAMALSAQLGGAGMTAKKLDATATVTLDKVGDGFSITKSHIDLVAEIPGADQAKFDAAVKAAETGCPVSKLFKAEISVSAKLVS